MKLRFRAEAKDIVIFLIFCVVLLYFVAIGVLNIAQFAEDSTFYGLNPIEAFSSEYLSATLVFFFFALVGIFLSVQSYFFDREEGIGIKVGKKKDKGYSRWATVKEVKKVLAPVNPKAEKSEAGGIPLINDGKTVWVDNGEFHNLIIGSTGSGKTQMTVFPMVKTLAKNSESMIITDPKGEIYEETANMLKEKGYNIVLLNFRDPQKGNAWNPMHLPYSLYKSGNSDKASELLDDLAMNILYDEKSQNADPFWEKTSADYFAGLALGLFEDAKEDEINLNSINLMTTVGEEKFMATTYIKDYFSYKDPASPAYVNASSTLMAPNETKGSILSVFKQKIKLFSSRENLSEMLSHSDFDMKDIGRQKTAVFIVIQDEKKTYHSLVTIFLKQCYETLIDVAQECGGKLPYRTNFILDEFANMPPLKDVTTMVTAARSRRIRFSFIIQNFAQLYQVYGKENGETIKGNCGNIVYLISSELSALEEISKMCGEVKSKEKDKTASTPLVTVSDLQRLPQWSLILVRTRMMPFKTVMTPEWKMNKNNCWDKKYEKATYPDRAKEPVQLFDLKSFVQAKREEKMKAIMGDTPNGGGMNPMMGMGMPGMNPMMGMGMPGMNSGMGPGMPPRSNPGGGLNVDDLVKRIDAKIAELEEEERREKEKQEALEKAKETDAKSNADAVKLGNVFDLAKEDNVVEAKIEPSETTIKHEFKLEEPKKEETKLSFEDLFKTTTKVNKDVVEAKVEDVKEEVKPNIDIKDFMEPKNEIKIEPEVNNKGYDKDYISDDQFFDDFFSDDE